MEMDPQKTTAEEERREIKMIDDGHPWANLLSIKTAKVCRKFVNHADKVSSAYYKSSRSLSQVILPQIHSKAKYNHLRTSKNASVNRGNNTHIATVVNIRNASRPDGPDVSGEVSRRQTIRKALIAQICSVNKGLRSQQSSWRLKLNAKNRYLFCPVPKSGWSSWKRLWFYTSGLIDSYDTDVGTGKDEKAGVQDVGGSLGAQKQWKAQTYNYSFVFFRNPWERLVSAYLNKAVEYNYSRILHSPCKSESMQPYKEDLTFTQFLTCIAQGSNDMHWTPQWKLCNVCAITFDFIGHLETVDEDAAAVIAHIGLNVAYPHSFASKTNNKTLPQWYSAVPYALLKSLMKRYRFDFELHGYDKQPPGRPDLI